MSERAAGCEDGVCVPKKNSNNDQAGAISDGTSQLDVSAAKDEGALSCVSSSKSSNNTFIKVDIISDTMCPWCWVGKRNLEAALKDCPEIAAEVTWLPYFLDKKLPDEGKPVQDYYRDNYGDLDAGNRMKPNLVRAGKLCGVDFETHYIHMDRYRPTIRSHRLIEYAKDQGKQDAMVEELFRMYYEQGKQLNSLVDLSEAAAAVGLAGDVAAFLAGSEKEQEVYATAARVAPLAQGVPTFIFSRPSGSDAKSFSFSGGQPPEAFRRVFEAFASTDA